MEQWEQIGGYEGLYEVSNTGKVRSLDRLLKSKTGQRFYKGSLMALTTNHWGYVYISLRKNLRDKKMFVHVLAAKAFIKNPDNKPCVNHKDGVKGNNNISNLEWVTRSENTLHSFRVLGKKANKTMLGFTGAACPHSIPINQMDLDGNLIKVFSSQKEAARILGIRQGNISSAINGKYKTTGGFKWSFHE